MDDIKKWLISAGIRALKTACQTALSILSVATILQDVDWMLLLSASALSALMSILTSIAGLPEAAEGKPLPALLDDMTKSDDKDTR